MALTRSYDEFIEGQLRERPGLRRGLLCEAVQALASGEADVAKALLRKLVKAGIGYESLSERTGTPPESLMRMLSPRGNPTLTNFGRILAALREAEGVEFEIAAKG